MSQELVVIQKETYWGKIEEQLASAVVQVIAQIEKFDWIEPYLGGDQFENQGTGFFISEAGHIVTNFHVIEEAQSIWIIIPFLGRKMLRANLISLCPDRDLALLQLVQEDLIFLKKMMDRPLVYLTLGNSDEVKKTTGILTLGYPLGCNQLKGTIGIVSGRDFLEGKSLLQITAPINPGSSGGPLIDEKGVVIGITVSMVLNATNIGYAIAINELHVVLNDMTKKRLVRRPVFGARFIHSDDEKAEFLGNPVPSGLYISSVFPGGLFHKAGVHVGDMMYTFAGFQLDQYGETVVPWGEVRYSLPELASRLVIGDALQMVVYRYGKKMVLETVVTDDCPFSIYKKYPGMEEIDYEIIGGIVVMDLADNHLDILSTQVPTLVSFNQLENKDTPQLVVTHVVPGSNVYKYRTVRAGDIIVAVNGKPVSSVASIRDVMHALLKEAKEQYLALKFADGVLFVISFQELFNEVLRATNAGSYPNTVLSSLLLEIMKQPNNQLNKNKNNNEE